ncbi:MAG: di-heme oxidoredictase family protein [Planctomycetota bacterium]
MHRTESTRRSSLPQTGWLLGLGVAVAIVTAHLIAPSSHAEIISDDTPVPPVGALGGPSRALDPAEMEQFIRGRKVFDRDWRLGQGLGNDFNGDSCRSCHQDPVIGGSGGLDVNVFRFANDNGGAGPFMDLPGGQIASKLRRPDLLGREDHDTAADLFEQRNSPSVLGLGLIETIEAATIFANEDPNDTDGDGVRGVARMVDVAGTPEVGRLGWKAGVPQIEDFIGDAMGNEIGITSPDTGRGFAFLTDADGVADPELSTSDFDDMLFFMQLLAAPPRGGSSNPMVALGEQVFSDIGCDTCHTPTLPGADGPVPLYSNLLLHDIHGPTFRGMAEAGADVGFYRTPPLWGVRFTAPYLHDGRAETLLDAVLMHADEAQASRDAYDALSPMEQDALIEFLSDL